jgi:hypothetical protein
MHQIDTSSYMRHEILNAVYHTHYCNGHGERSNWNKLLKTSVDTFNFVGVSRGNRIPNNRDVQA